MKKIRHMGMPFQAGIIDVGAHSIRLDIFEVSKKNGISLLESLSRTINLGYDVFRHGQVSPETLARLSSMLSDFALKLAEYRITFCRVVATSAIREAFNRDLVINRIRNDAGLELEVLETPEEIRITYLAMREALRRRFDFGMLSGIGLMIGTGSLQIFYFAHGLMRFCEEIPLGTTRLFDAFGRSAISIEQVIETLRSQDIGQRLAECVLFIILLSFLRITKHLIGLVDSLKLVFGSSIIRIQVGMIFARQLTERLLDVILRCRFVYSKDLIIINVSHSL